ncbi:MAG: hypothetical protein IPP49_17040 [Saprospiraceae bacterium]|nr:hypothetical protein [Saprospiraceae bacterium]
MSHNTHFRTNSIYNLNINNSDFVKGEEVRIPVYASENITTLGLQMSIKFSDSLS